MYYVCTKKNLGVWYLSVITNSICFLESKYQNLLINRNENVYIRSNDIFKLKSSDHSCLNNLETGLRNKRHA